MRRRALCATLVAGLTLAAAAPAFAHDELLGTSPKSGATVAHLPTTIKINFGEPPIRVVGVTLTRAGANHVVRARLNPKNAKQILVTTRKDSTGRYLAKWTIIAPDGDKQVGTFAFRVSR
jgi:methionine-rich copper-binding protein CopC